MLFEVGMIFMYLLLKGQLTSLLLDLRLHEVSIVISDHVFVCILLIIIIIIVDYFID